MTKFTQVVIRPHQNIIDLTIQKNINKKEKKFNYKNIKSIVVCIHGKVWDEGDLYEENGGKACKECIEYNILPITKK